MDRFTQDPEWLKIEEILIKKINDLLDIREVDISKSSEDVKIEIFARKLAGEKLIEFYNQNGFSKKRLEDLMYDFK